MHKYKWFNADYIKVSICIVHTHLSCGEQRHCKLQESLDLDLHGGQRSLEDSQGLQNKLIKDQFVLFKGEHTTSTVHTSQVLFIMCSSTLNQQREKLHHPQINTPGNTDSGQIYINDHTRKEEKIHKNQFF